MAEFLHKLSENDRELLHRIVRLAGQRLSQLAKRVGGRLGLPGVVWPEIDKELTHVVVLALEKGAECRDWGNVKRMEAAMKRNPRKKFTAREMEQIAELRRRGGSYAAVADKMGCSRRKVERFCKKNGLERGGLTTFVFDDEAVG